jgi:hypothetical protein
VARRVSREAGSRAGNYVPKNATRPQAEPDAARKQPCAGPGLCCPNFAFAALVNGPRLDPDVVRRIRDYSHAA